MALSLAFGLSMAATPSAGALDFGPISLTGLAKIEGVRRSPACPSDRCERNPTFSEDPGGAGEFTQRANLASAYNYGTYFQPTVNADFDLRGGLKLSGVLSRRWSSGNRHFWYDRRIGLEHEDWGSVNIGTMPTRALQLANDPFGGDISLAEGWSSGGTGYQLLPRAVRITSRRFGVLEGDAILEATVNRDDTGWRGERQQAYEAWIHFGSRDWSVDVLLQNARGLMRNWLISGPIFAPYFESSNKDSVDRLRQGMAMTQLRWRYTTKIELLSGLRVNRWGVDAPAGQSARTMDLLIGTRYTVSRWTASLVGVRLGQGSMTSDRKLGPSHSGAVGIFQLTYLLRKGASLYGLVGAAKSTQPNPADLGAPANIAPPNTDASLDRSGHRISGGVVYRF